MSASKTYTEFEYRGYTGIITQIFLILPRGFKADFNTHWFCGYAVLPSSHPLSGVDYQDVENDFEIEVHGGLTFSGDKINNSKRWALGFDCNHAYDDPRIQDEAYVRHEIEKLIDQLIEIEQRRHLL